MRIAYLTGEYPRATDTFVQREVATLRTLGVDVRTIAIRCPGPEHDVGPEQRREREQTTYLLPSSPLRVIAAHARCIMTSPRRYFSAARLAWKTRQPSFSGHMYQFFYFLEAAILADLQRNLKFEHLHNHFANSSCSVSMLAAEMGGFPFSFTLHGPAIFFEPHRWRIDEKIARARFVACISHFCRSQGMVFAAPEHWTKMRIIHCGIDPDLYSVRSHAGRGNRLLFVGRLAAAKGLPILLESFRRLPPDTTLTVVGDGELRADVSVFLHRYSLGHRVRLVGYKSQREVRDLLSEHDVFVMASFAEGIPVVLMEAMASGLPVIAPHIAGIPELVQHGVSGLLVPPGDPEALAAAIKELIPAPDRRATMGAAGRQFVIHDFNSTTEAKRIYRLFMGEPMRDVQTTDRAVAQDPAAPPTVFAIRPEPTAPVRTP